MAFKYYYLDDVNDGTERGTINGLQHGDSIFINFEKPQLWELQIKEIRDTLKKCDGLILDLRLNDNPNDRCELANYRGSTLASEIRTLIKEGEIENDIPIILFSANDQLIKSFDVTSDDLFDYRVSKNSIGIDFNYGRFQKLLTSFANSYKVLQNKSLSILEILSLPSTDILDERFVHLFNEKNELQRHDLVRFITKQVLEKPSFLIGESTLAARLGVKLDSPDWPKLLGILGIAEYKGILGDYYRRWWMPLVEQWWEENIDSNNTFRSLDSIERVRRISEKCKLVGLLPIEKGDYCRSSKFWTVCRGTEIPIDTIDGFVIANQDNSYPWQEKEYVSIKEALRPSNKNSWNDVAIIEKNRLQQLKSIYLNEQRIRK